MCDLFNILLILRTPGVGPVRYHELLDLYGSFEAVVDSLHIPTRIYDSVCREIELANKLSIHFITEADELYPIELKKQKYNPPLLTARGNLDTLKNKKVGMFGTRHATLAGMTIMANIAQKFAMNDYVVVSGMAIGTDTSAHLGALRENGDRQTIAVLAGGVDYVWPVENESLYMQILERGLVISSMPIGYIPKSSNFVQRNRLIAGLSEFCILGEADLKSGSMTTAKFTCEAGKNLYAIPSHPTDSRSAGPNTLIRTGVATLCMGPDDFFNDLSVKHLKDQNFFINNHINNIVFDKIGTIPVSESVLTEVVKKDITEIKQELVMLELQGLIKKQDGGYVRV